MGPEVWRGARVAAEPRAWAPHWTPACVMPLATLYPHPSVAFVLPHPDPPRWMGDALPPTVESLVVQALNEG